MPDSKPIVISSTQIGQRFSGALLLAFAPMTIGTAILGLYFFTRHPKLIALGDAWFWLSPALLAIGAYLLLTCRRLEPGAKWFPKNKREGRPYFLVILLMALNFPAAHFCAKVTLVVKSICTVTIVNDTARRMDRCVLEDATGPAGDKHIVGDASELAPGSETVMWFVPENRGDLKNAVDTIVLTVQANEIAGTVTTGPANSAALTMSVKPGEGVLATVHVMPGLKFITKRMK